MAIATAAVAGIGHNRPPLKDVLAEQYKFFADEIEKIAKRADEAPKTIKSDDDLDKVGVVIKDAREMYKRAEAARKEEKEPYLKAGKEVDAFFKVLTDRLESITLSLQKRADEYQREKAAEARRKAEEEARRLREQEEAARRKAEEAAAAGKAALAGRAEARAEIAAEKAVAAEELAQASAAELARFRGASGTLATAKTVQKVRIADWQALNLNDLKPYIDREAVQKAANAWLRVTKGREQIIGLEVYEDVRADFR